MRSSEHVTVHSPAWRRSPWRGTDARRGAGRDESGAILILALIFLVVVGGVVGSLASWATNDLKNTTQFTSARTEQYAVSSAAQTAVQNIRYTPLLSTDQTPSASPSYCWGAGPTSELTLDNETVAVWCSTVWTPTSASTRVVTFSACPVTSAESGDSAATLASLCAAPGRCHLRRLSAGIQRPQRRAVFRILRHEHDREQLGLVRLSRIYPQLPTVSGCLRFWRAAGLGAASKRLSVPSVAVSLLPANHPFGRDDQGLSSWCKLGQR
jgi:hypothetical protein